MKQKLFRIITFCLSLAAWVIIFTSEVSAQADPVAEINAIVERIITIATQVGSGILILFIVKDAFDLMQNKDNPMVRNMLARDVFLLIIAAIFLFRPDFILDSIRFIANA